MKTFVLIDSNALIHRSFHALPPLTSPSGEIVNAVYGFTTVLMKVLKELKPDYAAAAFDLPAPTFRHEHFKEYKATRKKAPDELYAQIPLVKEVLKAFGIPVYEKAGFEADDVIGTINRLVEEKRDIRTIIVTGDSDTLQLVDKNTGIYTLRKGVADTALYGEKEVEEKFEGLKPGQMNDYKGLKGDVSDNVPGVPGVGEKTALALIKKFGSMEKLYEALEGGERLDFVRGGDKLAQNLLDHKKQAFFSKQLVTLRLDVPVDLDIEKCRIGRLDKEKINRVFQTFGFYSLTGRLAELGVQEKTTHPTSKENFKTEEVKNKSGAEKTLKFLKTQTEIGIGLVATGEKWREAALQGIFIQAGGRLLYFPARFAGNLKEVLEDGRIMKFGYNLKFIYEVLAVQGIKLDGSFFDILVAAYLLNPGERAYPLPKIVFQELGEEPAVQTDVKKQAARDLDYCAKIRPALERKIREADAEKVFFGIEMPLIPVLARMEMNGVRIDKKRLRKLSGIFAEKIKNLEAEIYRLAGVEFNINSPRQLGDVLFNKMGIGIGKVKKTPGGEISTRASELLKLRHQHPLVDLILDFRELVKLKNTYIDVLPDLADAKTGRVYATFNQVGTATGRLASDSPNLQNIPAKGDWAREIRKSFLSDGGFKMVSCDYSQIELRIVAHMAKDEKMIAIFNEGGDIHRATAAEINNVPPGEVTKEMRQRAKTLNFGVLYGMSAQGFSQAAGIPFDAARKFIEEYFHDFQGVKNYVEETKRRAAEKGFVETLTGRRRLLPEIHTSNFQLRSEAERMAVNMPIQGLAADIIKTAMVRIGEDLRGEMESGGLRMIIQVHDELVFEVKDDILKTIAPQLKKIMEGVFKLVVPVIVDVKIGENWSEMKEYGG